MLAGSRSVVGEVAVAGLVAGHGFTLARTAAIVLVLSSE